MDKSSSQSPNLTGMDFKQKALSTAILILAASMVPIALASSPAPDQPKYSSILREALSQQFDRGNLDLVSKYIETQDAVPAKQVKGSAYALYLAQSIDRNQKKFVNLAQAADTNPRDRFYALKTFASLLHTVQDFYSKTDYISETIKAKSSKRGAHAVDPYQLDFADWEKIKNKSLQYESADIATIVPDGAKIARELSLRETQRQWEILEALIKQKYPDRSSNILTALKSASTPYDKCEPDDFGLID